MANNQLQLANWCIVFIFTMPIPIDLFTFLSCTKFTNKNNFLIKERADSFNVKKINTENETNPLVELFFRHFYI